MRLNKKENSERRIVKKLTFRYWDPFDHFQYFERFEENLPSYIYYLMVSLKYEFLRH